MKIGLVTDSVADIPINLVEEHQIEVVPAILVVDGDEFIDGVDISRKEFYTRMPDLKSPATTAAPSAGEFMERYEKLFSKGVEKIFSIHAASQLSGIFNAARVAATSFGERIQLIDSGQLSLGIGFQVLEAAEAISKGKSFAEINNFLQNIQEKIKLSAALDTLEYLRRSGRVSWAKARVAALLSLKPLIGLAYGKVENFGAVRTKGQAHLQLMEQLDKTGDIKRLAVLHTNDEERAHQFLTGLTPSLQKEAMTIRVTPVIGAHLGPKGVGFIALKK